MIDCYPLVSRAVKAAIWQARMQTALAKWRAEQNGTDKPKIPQTENRTKRA